LAGIYFHIPFCAHKCIYCDFYSIEESGSFDVFLDKLQTEIRLYAPYGEKEPIRTVFFGGGTPSLLEPDALKRILDQFLNHFSLEGEDSEITLEANPGTVDRRKLAEMLSLGFNRISFGVQSFRDEDLKFLTRIHTAEEARRAVSEAKEAGFENISMDLLFALPAQTLAAWEKNLQEAVKLQPQHISAYSLIYEKGTPLAQMVESKLISPLPLESEALMYEFTMEFLGNSGYEHYEVSNYAKPDFYSKHNMAYWTRKNYLGFGPSAHSFWSNKRWWNVSDLTTYSEKLAGGNLPVQGEEDLTERQIFDEKVMLGLRSSGLDVARLQLEYGTGLAASLQPVIRRLIGDGLAVYEDMTLRLNDRGFLICDSICQDLLFTVGI